MASPLEQFEIHALVPMTLAGFDVSFSNSAFWMVLSALAAIALTVFTVKKDGIVPGRWQNIAEMCYGTVRGMIDENVGEEGRKYFPLVFTIFMFVLCGNLLGMIPGSFTFTSHLAVTFTMAAFIFIMVTLIGIFRHGFHFLGLFAPHGAPWWSLFLIVPVEVVSYLSRPISLSIRLFANMTVGHTIIKVLAGFFFGLFSLFPLLGAIPIAALVGITALEFLVALLQAYIFTILTCIYLHDAIHLH